MEQRRLLAQVGFNRGCDAPSLQKFQSQPGHVRDPHPEFADRDDKLAQRNPQREELWYVVEK